MAIQNAVGPGRSNQRDDVTTVQVLLNMSRGRTSDMGPVDVDGVWGDQTGAAIEVFQRKVMQNPAADRCVDPNGATLKALRDGVPAGMSSEKVRGIIPAAKIDHVLRYYAFLEPKMNANGIDTPLRQAHFLAQVAHESGALRYCEEIADGSAYENRPDLGNTKPGDGKRFKGRGLIQLTGRANYKAYGEAIGRDLCQDATCTLVATEPDLAVDVACWFWKWKKVNERADQDDVEGVTRRINGGLNGLADRKRYLERARFFLGI